MPAWFWNIAMLGWLLTALAPIVTEVSGAMFGGDAKFVVVIMFFAIGIMTAIWAFWVCPLLDTQNPNPRWKYEPKQRMRSMRLMFFAPVGILAVCCLINSMVLIERIRLTHELSWGWTHVAWLSMFLAIPLLILWGLYLSKLCERRLADACFKRHICFTCGYDLAGNPEARSCPECGEHIPHHVLPIFQRRARETMRYRHLLHEFEVRGITVRSHESLLAS